jgi:signal peptidase I
MKMYSPPDLESLLVAEPEPLEVVEPYPASPPGQGGSSDNATVAGAPARAVFTKAERYVPEHEARRARRVNRVANVLIAALCVSIVAGSVLFAVSDNPGKSFFGYRFYQVLTTSMTPGPDSPEGGFYAGDIIIVRKTAPQDIRVGDIVTFMPGDDPRVSLTHRVRRILDAATSGGITFITKGDANNADDAPVAAERIFGKKVLVIPKVGLAIDLVRSNVAVYALLVAAVIGFLVTVRYFFGAPPEKKEEWKT